jgi:hypothetical protein
MKRLKFIELLDHQKKFIRKFLLSNAPGAICYHGVGTGKTITAAVASHYYLVSIIKPRWNCYIHISSGILLLLMRKRIMG